MSCLNKSGSVVRGIFLVFCVVFSGWAADLQVPADFPTIQAAIDSAHTGDTVSVAPGRYYENINFNGKNIILTSLDPENPDIVATTIIDGSQPSAPDKGSVITFTHSETRNAVVTGFTIEGGSGTFDNSLGESLYLGGAIFCKNSSPTIKLNIIKNNTCIDSTIVSYGAGIATMYSDALILNNIIKQNNALAGGGVIIIFGNARIASNLIYDNSAQVAGGVVLLYGGVLVDNTIIRNSALVAGNVYTAGNQIICRPSQSDYNVCSKFCKHY